MNCPKIQNHKIGPEGIIQDAVIKFLRHREWFVMETHGSLYSRGWPDLYCTHRKYGIRWVEIKNYLAYSFTPSQREFFPLLSANGTGIWVLVAATETEYQKLWCPPNWGFYLMMLNQNHAH